MSADKLLKIEFGYFIRNIIDLNKNDVKKACKSRDNLIESIIAILKKNWFFNVYEEQNLNYGSFENGTKILELDDIDIMICVKANYRKYDDLLSNNIIKMVANARDMLLRNECLEDNTKFLNSTKVLNLFKNELSNINYYEKADIHKNKEAVTLKLKSYNWNFDIVPCFFTAPEYDGRQYYLIPDGEGNWKKSDPRIDKNNIEELNETQLNTIKLIKYWNKKKQITTMKSYVLECMLLKHFKKSNNNNIPIYCMFKNALKYISENISKPIYDPKDIQGNLNKLNKEEYINISQKAKEDYYKCDDAIYLFKNNDYNASINRFCEVLNDFNSRRIE